ncbi:S-layer homology domain-containing protein [Vallitalea maricola]|uniref:Uncharacterized protein n=1 Tax=Vallitalea maricola TaxID=3074433 RepID=A0ACB5UD93_9FIRM|nr:hypothetical protein AN2V17_00810 [Vallitalea sp. AN17-2]
MTKKISALLLVLCMILSTSHNIYAINNNVNKINVLTKLEILKGNGNSLNLEGQLSRSEAAAFIVRLLGEEQEVTNNKEKYNNTGFIDVPQNQWFAPYIGYCVQKDIINGYKDGTFKPKDKLGEKAFFKLILTSLGYKYNEDFTWNNVFSKAYGIGLVSDLSYSNGHKEDTNFTRGEVADIIYRTLQMKNNKTKVRMAQAFVDNAMISKSDAIEYELIEDELETKISSVIAKNSTTIEVTFNEHIQPITLENILIYEASGTTEILPIQDISKKESTDTYIIKTSEDQKMDEEYIMLVDKVIDTNGNPANTLNTNFMGFRADELVSDFFRISKVEAISNNIIYVYFTHPINDNALQSAFYTIEKDGAEIIKGDNTNILINKLSTCNNGVSIFFKSYVFTEEEYFNLDVNGQLSSTYGVGLNKGDGDSVKFKASVLQNDIFSVESCLPVNNRTIQLNFNKEINPKIAKQVFSYYITDYNNTPIKIDKAEVLQEGVDAGKAVRLTINSVILVNKEYKVLINHMTDVTNQFSIYDKEYLFTGNYYTVKDIEIEAVLPVDENTIIAYISKPLDEEYAKIASNYQIQGITTPSFMAIPTAVYYDNEKDSHMIKIYLSKDKKLKQSQSYKLRAITLKDTMGNVQHVIKTNQFNFTSSNSVDIFINEAKIIGDKTIKIGFNKEIDFNINNVLASNYKLIYVENGVEYSKIPIGANYIDENTITLNFDVLNLEKDYKITFSKLIDYGKNETDNKDGKYSMEVTSGN